MPALTPFGPQLEEEDVVNPIEPVVFVEAPEQEESNMAAARVIKAANDAAAAEPVTVRVVANFRVVHEGKPYVGGEVVEVPAETATLWIRSKWVELAPVSKKASA
jgi:hypothetical protein